MIQRYNETFLLTKKEQYISFNYCSGSQIPDKIKKGHPNQFWVAFYKSCFFIFIS